MRVTLKDVAREANVSVAACSATLNGSKSGNMRIGPVVRQQILDAAAKLGYVPNPIARSLSTGQTGVLGLLFPYVDAFIDRNPFCSMVMHGVISEAIASSYNMMLYTVRDGALSGRHRIDPRVDGLIVVLPCDNDPFLQLCLEQGFPCVAVVCGPEPSSIMTVNAADFEGGVLATEHLLALGHERILILHGGDKVPTNRPRLEGYQSALRRAGHPVDASLIVEAGFDWRPGFDAMSAVLDRPRREWPTAVFAINDLCASGAMRAICSRGLGIPDEIAVVGFDDTWFATTTRPMLTSVRMPISEMGALATRMLATEVGGTPIVERNAVLEVSLTVRNSCGFSAHVIHPDFAEASASQTSQNILS